MIHQRPVDQEVAFTNEWWSRIVNTEERLMRWLQKLQQTEAGGYYDYVDFLAKFTDIDDRTRLIFSNIAADEMKHSGLIIGLMRDRGWEPADESMPSAYWDSMNTRIVDVKTAAAVNYFGEALAAFRFELIEAHPETPADVRELIRIVLPDEQFHRQTLKRIAGDDLLQQFAEHHHNAVSLIKGGSK